MTDKITDIEERITRSLQDSLNELYLIRQEEMAHCDDVKERAEALVHELRDLAVAIDNAIADYDRSREELMEVSHQGNTSHEKNIYEQASKFMKMRGALEERYRLLGSQREELLQEQRRLERLVAKSEKMANRLRMVIGLISAPDDFTMVEDVARNSETLSAAFQLAEREAITFARELHDGPTQTFSAVGLMLEMCREYINKGDIKVASDELDRALEQTRNGLDEIRSFLFSLSPTGIQDGFELPAKRLVSQLRQMYNCTLAFTFSGPLDDLPSSVRTGAFKTLHQAVMNAARHGSSEVKVAVSYVKKTLKVRVTDNGKGFDVEKEKQAAKERGSYGLINMEDRVKMLGGNISVSSVLNRGTSVSFSIPILLDA